MLILFVVVIIVVIVYCSVDFVLVFGSFICLVVEVSLINHFKNNSHNYQDMVRYLAIARPLVLLR